MHAAMQPSQPFCQDGLIGRSHYNHVTVVTIDKSRVNDTGGSLWYNLYKHYRNPYIDSAGGKWYFDTDIYFKMVSKWEMLLKIKRRDASSSCGVRDFSTFRNNDLLTIPIEAALLLFNSFYFLPQFPTQYKSRNLYITSLIQVTWNILKLVLHSKFTHSRLINIIFVERQFKYV